MPQYLKEYGERLVDLGYLIVPLPPGSKGPHRKGWPKFRADTAQVRQWYSNGSVNDGIGVLAATTPAIDVDILDKEVSDLMSDEIDRIFAGQSLMTRTGKAPKFLIPFRSDEPFRKLSSNTYTDGKNDHKVEILGDGQQWVAYHTHPDTGRPYVWWDGVSDAGITENSRDLLPELSRDDAQRVIDAFEVLAKRKVDAGLWHWKSVSVERQGAVDEPDPFAAHAGPVHDLSRSQIEWVVSRIQNDEADYDRWFSVLCAIHHQLGDDGLELARTFSEKSSKHNAEVFEAKYASIGAYTGPMATLRSFLKETGQPPKGNPTPVSTGDFVQAAAFSSAQKVEWHIKHVIPKRGLIVVYGAPGSSKSFFVLDMVAHIARGLEWRGHRVAQSRVAYVAAEGVAGFGNRLAAYSEHHGTPLADVPVFVRGGALMLNDSALQITEAVNHLGGVGVVVIDTLAAVTPGANENTSEDMGEAIRSANLIMEGTGASVILIHHANKNNELRGWSGLLAAADNTIRVEHEEATGLRAARVEKQKEGRSDGKYGYRLKVVDLGHDEDGDAITSCVIEPCEEVAPKSNGKKQRKSTAGDFETSDKLGKARAYLSIIEDLVGMGDANVDEMDVISAIQGDETVNPLKEPDHPRPDSIKRTLLTLADKGKIRKEGRWIRVCR